MSGRGGVRRAAALVLALSWALAFAGCEGDGGGSPAAPTPALAAEASAPEAPPPEASPPRTPDAPVTLRVAQAGPSGGTTGVEPNQVVGPADPVTLVDGGSGRHVPLDRLFSGGDPGTVQVTSEDETVVTAQFVSDAAPPYVNIAPAGPGRDDGSGHGGHRGRVRDAADLGDRRGGRSPSRDRRDPARRAGGRGAGHPLEPRRRLRAGRAPGGGRVAGR